MPQAWFNEEIERYAEHNLPGLATESQISDVERRLSPQALSMVTIDMASDTGGTSELDDTSSFAGSHELDRLQRGRSPWRDGHGHPFESSNSPPPVPLVSRLNGRSFELDGTPHLYEMA